MMISAKHFYETELKGKTVAEINTCIRRLKCTINSLKKTIEHPEYVPALYPSESVRLSCTRDYLTAAIKALEKCGNTYTMTKAELKAKEFDDNIENISSIEFYIGGYLTEHQKRTLTFSDDKILVERDMLYPPSAVKQVPYEVSCEEIHFCISKVEYR